MKVVTVPIPGIRKMDLRVIKQSEGALKKASFPLHFDDKAFPYCIKY